MKALRSGLFVLLTISYWSWAPLRTSAQVGLSSISGTITDTQSNRIPEAIVHAVQYSTGFERKTSASREGTYVLEEIPPGTYSVSFVKRGFSEFLAQNVQQTIGRTRTLNVTLRLAGTASRITVQEPLVQLDTTSAALGAAVEQKQIKELPLNGRNWASLTALTPGAVDSGPSDQRTIRFAGHGLDDNEVFLDGVDDTGVLNQAQKEYVRLAIPLDAISEFDVKAQNFNADLGLSAGGQVLVASPSGTDNFHGNAFDYFRNDVLDSRSPFDPSSPAPFLLNQFGASIGGPIKPHKTLFYANYEGLRQRLGQTQIGLVPSSSALDQAGTTSPALMPILKAYPAGSIPTANAQVDRYIAGANQVDNEDSGMIRVDQHFSDRTTAFMRFSRDVADYTVPTGSLNARSLTNTRLLNGVADLLHVFAPTVVNDAKFGINQDIYHTAYLTNIPYSVSVAGLSALNGNSTTDGDGTTFSAVDDLTWVKGRHVLKFGGIIRWIQMNQGNSESGTLTYTSLAKFLDNNLDGATYTSLLPLKRLRKTQYFAYVQDEWKATPNLTINMGLRYNFFNVFHETNGRAIPFDFATCGGYCSSTDSFSRPRYNDFDPRAGIAWAHGFTVVRAGGGIYHSDGQEDDQNLPISNDVARYTLTAAGSPGLAYPIAPFLQATTGIITPRDLYRDRKDMYVAAWTASVQRNLPANVLATLSYAGNKGTDILTTTYTNVLNLETGMRPYPEFGPTSWRGNDSNSTFHALQFNVRREFAAGWLVSANYMWSHSINDDGIGGGESDTPQNVFCRACEKASSDYDIRQVFNASAVYQLPFGAGKRFFSNPALLRTVFGGWQLSGIGTARTGLPVNVVVDRENSSVPGGYSLSGDERPDLVSGVSLTPPGGQTPNSWINPAAFAIPAPGAFGNAGRNLVRGPSLWQIDAALAKTITFSERVGLQCRAEVFNVFNRAQYGNPNADLSSQLFGVITTPVNQGATGSGTPRQMQLALRLFF